MAKQEKSVHKKSRGRPPGRSYGETVPLRLSHDMIIEIDHLAAKSGNSRSAMVRTLLEEALKKRK
jgi:hypothetical protein